MRVKKLRKRRSSGGAERRDPEKERHYRSICEVLSNRGVQVRREELKRGHGWQVMSGVCRVEAQPVVFVDRRLSQDDQISFLVDKVIAFGFVPEPNELDELPKNIAALFG